MENLFLGKRIQRGITLFILISITIFLFLVLAINLPGFIKSTREDPKSAFAQIMAFLVFFIPFVFFILATINFIRRKSSFMSRFKEFWVNRSKKTKFLLSLAILSSVLLITFPILKIITRYKSNLPPSVSEWEKLVLDKKYTPAFTLSPNEERKFGILSQEVFILKTKKPQDENFIKENIISSKPISITKKSDTEFEIRPVNSLGIDETISISLKGDSDYNWIFQTAPKFEITENLPKNEAKDVPVNAGIEITFNNDNFKISESNIEIEPKLNFRIEKRDEKALIIPIELLRPKTIYKVTIKKGLRLFSENNFISNDYSFSFQTADENQNRGRITLTDNFQEIFPDEPPITKIYSNNWNPDEIINAEVYKFSSVEEFISSRVSLDKITSSWTKYYGEENMVNTKELGRVFKADLKLQEKEKLQYLQLPQSLEEGLYLVQFWFDNYKKVEQLWLQSSSMVGYVSVGKQQTVIWVNSSMNESLGSSTINILGMGENYYTNNQGWSAFPTPAIFNEKIKHYILVTGTNGKKLILPVDILSDRPKPNAIVADDYWSYIYHERLLYKPNDTVYFWGVVKNRDTGTAPPSVEIYLNDNFSQSVVPLSDGSFIGNIKLDNTPSGYKQITSRIDGVVIAGSSFEVSEYAKPELKIEVEGNKKAIFSGESVDYKAKVTFFDGTPAVNMGLNISSIYHYGEVDRNEAVTDKNGEVRFKYKSKLKEAEYGYPRYEGVAVSAVKSGEGASDGFGSVYVFGSSLQIETKSSQSKDKAIVEATVNTLDLSLINEKGLSNPVSGIARNQKVELTTTKRWWEKKETGKYYDFVEKVTKPTFDFIEHKETIDEKDFSTDNDGKVKYDFNLELDKSYTVKLKVIDKEGRSTEDYSYFYYPNYQENSDQPEKAHLNLDRNSNLFSIGEEVDIKIQKNGVDYQKSPNSKFLFILANRGRQDVYVLDLPELRFNYEQKHVPNIYVGSIIFNGRRYEEVEGNCRYSWKCGGYDYFDYYYDYYNYYGNDYFFNPIVINYNYGDSKLTVEITSDKTKYQPSEEAKITVKVTKNNTPIENASVQITVVDEALAAIDGVKEPTILSSLYEEASSFIYYSYYSHKNILPDVNPAEGGGGGGGDRDLFKDTAFFGTKKTDSNGEITFNVKLPDNITKWLVYAQALTNSVDAGQAEFSIITSKEFFATSQFPKTTTLKDSPFVAVSFFGNLLKENSKIPGEVVFYKEDQELAKNSFSVFAFKEDYFEFPKLTVGDYKVAVRGNYEGYEDGIALPLKIIESRLDFNMAKNKILEKGQTLKSFDDISLAAEKPIKMIITDEGKGKYFYDLRRYCYQNSNRLERRISSIKADQILTSRFKDQECDNYDSDLSNFQASDGGLRQVEWGGSNLETTVWAVYVDQSKFNKEKLIKYFEEYRDSYRNTEEKILKNWGLTLLGIPKVNELNRLSKIATTYREKVLVGLALNSAGDIERSKEIYLNILSEYAYSNKPYLRIQSDPKKTDYDNYAFDTSYAFLLGSLSLRDYNDGFNLYLRDYNTQDGNVIVDIANITLIDTALSDLPDSDTIVSFKKNSQTLSQNITKDGPFVVDLEQSDINNFNLSVLEGKVEVSLDYYITPEEFSTLKSDNRISLKKTVTKIKGDGDDIKIGDILEINLNYNFEDKAPFGCYTLTDHIPSGMTYIDEPGNFGLSIGKRRLLYYVRDNIVKGCAYNSKWWKDYYNNNSVYFVRVSAVGKFVNEPAIMQSALDPSIFQKTSEEYVTVNK